MGYRGLDGKTYPDIRSMRLADIRVEQQREAEKAIQENNRLMQEQIAMQERKTAIEAEIAFAKMEQEKEMEQERIKHEKEMRILKLFDDVSIPFNIYKDFEDYLLTAKDMDFGEENQKHIKRNGELTEELGKLTNQYVENCKNTVEIASKNDDNAVSNKKVKYNEKYKMFQDFINDKIKIADLSTENWSTFNNDNEIQTLLNQLKKENDIKKKAISKCKEPNTKKMIIGIFITLIIVGIWTNMTIFLISCLAIVLLSFYFSKQVKIYGLKKHLNESINKKMLEEVKNDTELLNKIEEINKQIESILEKLKPLEKVILDSKMDLFSKFRFNHYNMKMEKLFVDVGLIEKCREKNIQFDIIDKNKISAEGTFEDYFNFFQNFANIYLDTSDN